MKRGGQSTLVTPFSYHILSSKLIIKIDSFPLPKIKKSFSCGAVLLTLHP
ncbi:hypothetical protein HMPREF0971_02978 [Segatella oris F0302]|uniref:Uncharacterized protein n=1 Tax=Segatella oris F0302 TaxID=649760 RepID=D1QVJ9_9BACT|nr:hypothetical protein HMPREF0971_02978 [Segatella oris F0302]